MDTASTAIADADSMGTDQLAEEVKWHNRLEQAHEAGVEEGLRRAVSPDHDPLVAEIQHCLRLIPELMLLEPRLARELAGKLHDRMKAFDARSKPEPSASKPEPGEGEG